MPPRVAEPVAKARGQMPQSAPAAEPAPPLETPESILAAMTERWSRMDSFESRVVRREAIRGITSPTEVLAFRYRKKPYSVRFKWLGEEGKGREMLYVRDQYADKIHILTAPGDIPFSRAQSRMALAPDSPLVRARSRRSIRETGFDVAIQTLTQSLRERPGSVKVVGPTRRDEYPYPLLTVELAVAPREEEGMPDGGKRLMFFDTKADSPSFGLPVMVATYDAAGREIEYYCFDRFIHPTRFDDRDFHPDTLGR